MKLAFDNIFADLLFTLHSQYHFVIMYNQTSGKWGFLRCPQIVDYKITSIGQMYSWTFLRCCNYVQGFYLYNTYMFSKKFKISDKDHFFLHHFGSCKWLIILFNDLSLNFSAGIVLYADNTIIINSSSNPSQALVIVKNYKIHIENWFEKIKQQELWFENSCGEIKEDYVGGRGYFSLFQLHQLYGLIMWSWEQFCTSIIIRTWQVWM